MIGSDRQPILYLAVPSEPRETRFARVKKGFPLLAQTFANNGPRDVMPRRIRLIAPEFRVSSVLATPAHEGRARRASARGVETPGGELSKTGRARCRRERSSAILSFDWERDDFPLRIHIFARMRQFHLFTDDCVQKRQEYMNANLTTVAIHLRNNFYKRRPNFASKPIKKLCKRDTRLKSHSISRMCIMFY